MTTTTNLSVGNFLHTFKTVWMPTLFSKVMIYMRLSGPFGMPRTSPKWKRMESILFWVESADSMSISLPISPWFELWTYWHDKKEEEFLLILRRPVRIGKRWMELPLKVPGSRRQAILYLQKT